MYNKLFQRILYSSIWTQDYPTRIVWVTFLAAMDEDSVVHFATTKNVAAVAQVTEEEAERAVALLEAPDPHSANPEHEGRRVQRIPGGWVVLNAKVYRDIATREQARQRTAERVRKFRATGGGAEDKWNAIRYRALQRDDMTCRYCGQPADTVDHVVPMADGGSDSLDNLAAACRACNLTKGARTPEDAGMALRPVPVQGTADTHRVTVGNDRVTGSETETETKRSRSSRRDDLAIDDGFGVFWAAYPKKVARQAALRSWRRLRPDVDLQMLIMRGLEVAKRSDQWSRDGGAFICHASTWLNGGRWADDWTPAPASAAEAAVEAERQHAAKLLAEMRAKRQAAAEGRA